MQETSTRRAAASAIGRLGLLGLIAPACAVGLSLWPQRKAQACGVVAQPRAGVAADRPAVADCRRAAGR